EANLFHSPIPTQMVSNGEHMPIPQTEDQKKVEARIKEIADQASRKLNISRRQFLAGTGGMAAGFLAMNEVYGQMFKVDEDVLFDSQTTVGLLSNATLGVFPPGDPNGRPPNSIEESQAAGVLNAKQTAAVRDFVNRISGSQRMLAHGQLYPGRRSLYFMEQQVAENHPDAWKGYTVATSARGDNDPPDSPLKQWRLDDEQIAYPSYDFILRQRDQLRRHPGFRNICIHKGFSPAPIDTPEWGKPTDIPKASHDWPELNFIIYHACFGGMTPFLWPSPGLANIQNKVLRNGEPDITWLT